MDNFSIPKKESNSFDEPLNSVTRIKLIRLIAKTKGLNWGLAESKRFCDQNSHVTGSSSEFIAFLGRWVDNP